MDEGMSEKPRFRLGTIEDLNNWKPKPSAWRILDSGIEHTSGYFIDKERLHSLSPLRHMSDKEWCDMHDFVKVFFRARRQLFPHVYSSEWPEHKRRPIPVGRRFDVLQRDNFRCQLCGRSAPNGAVLEVDHRTARALGGTDDLDNLWTLCWECNRGKSDKRYEYRLE